jgi:hypothetical protein
MDTTALHAHVRAINDCNQRGGRMLSLVDLIAAGTVDVPLAAYLAALMRQGASLLVGARPGGAGKTAVMCALLNFLPDATAIIPTDGPTVFQTALRDTRYGETCYLAHEIGSGYYYAYIWGQQLRDFLTLAANGHSVASNLHADTLEETQDQLCRQNGADPVHLNAITLKLYLRVTRGTSWDVQRHIVRVYENDGEGDRLLWKLSADGWFVRQVDSVIVNAEQERQYRDILADFLAKDIRNIEDVRYRLLMGNKE